MPSEVFEKASNSIGDEYFAKHCLWVETVIGEPLDSFVPLKGDASFRRYFRATKGSQTWILMDSPPDQEDPSPFINVALWWLDKGIAVPQVLSYDKELGFILLEDLGDQLFMQKLTLGAKSALLPSDGPVMTASDEYCYREALELLEQIWRLDAPKGWGVRHYDDEALLAEMRLFEEWFVPEFCSDLLESKSLTWLTSVYDRLIQNAKNQKYVCVHRDYHARNLMWSNNRLFTIDFQDALWGPITYDLVSLFRDCYLCWSPVSEKKFLQGLFAKGGLGFDCYEDFYRSYEWMGLQRHLKVLGIFTRLWKRDGKSGYLQDLLRVLKYVVYVAERYEEFSALKDLLRKPLITKRIQQAIEKHAR